jgi:IS1 family transposase
MKGQQQYLCRECKHQFISEFGRHTEWEERMAISLYCYGLSFRTIAVMMLVNCSTICRWIKAFAKLHYKKAIPMGEIIIELDEMCHYIQSKKTNYGFGKPIVAQLDNLLTGNAEIRDTATFERMYNRLAELNVKIYYSDYWDSYAELIDWKKLKQTKAETWGIENNNGRQRHWFARFRRRTCVVSRSVEMVDLTMFLFAYFHVNCKKSKLQNFFRSFCIS